MNENEFILLGKSILRVAFDVVAVALDHLACLEVVDDAHDVVVVHHLDTGLEVHWAFHFV